MRRDLIRACVIGVLFCPVVIGVLSLFGTVTCGPKTEVASWVVVGLDYQKCTLRIRWK